MTVARPSEGDVDLESAVSTGPLASAVLLAVAAGLWLYRLREPLQSALYFDDAYMFARYAHNVRSGLGVSWNLDGIHTYGQTAPLWGLIVLLLSYLPLATSKMLPISSWLCAVGAFFAMAHVVSANAAGRFMTSIWRVLPFVALPLAFAKVFYANAGTGMETMLGVVLVAVYLGLVLGWQRGLVRPEVAALTGLLLFLTRPEGAIVVLILPVAVFYLMRGPTARSLALLLGFFLAGVLLDLALCRLYFHTALPLSFYMKSGQAYEGYRKNWHPNLSLLQFLHGCIVYLLAMAVLARRSDWRLIACCMAPALVVFAYLATVTQIMGFNARYYIPYTALMVVPALLVADRRLARRAFPKLTPLRVTAVGFLLLFGVALSSTRISESIDRHIERHGLAYDPVVLTTAAGSPLPHREWSTTAKAFADYMVVPLPAGSSVASSEVGYLGAFAPQVNIIDLAGLNDTEIALHGFHMDALLARKPDIIWMPHDDYTFQRGLMLSDPALLAQYDVYAGAAAYGIAIRKDGPARPLIDRQMGLLWNALYPGIPMSDYRVTGAGWTRFRRPAVD